MTKFDFYMTLPSNASMDFYENNGPSHFITKLPHEWRLVGEWVVGLSEIQFPQNFSHIPSYGSDNFVKLWSFDKKTYIEDQKSIKSGVYKDLKALLDEINTASPIAGHLKFEQDNGSHVSVKRTCGCVNTEHRFRLSRTLCKILGFDYNEEDTLLDKDGSLRSLRPASLSHCMPSIFFVYTDITEAHVTGNVQTPLLRVVPTDLVNFEYGSMRLRSFANIKYVPLLKSNFNTVEILIRDEFGKELLFDHGTLTVTLHFKRVD